jgi:hypothetical protein
MSRRKIKHFHEGRMPEKPMLRAEVQPKASKIFDKYHAKAMYNRLPIAGIPAFGTWACAKAGVGGELVTSYGADVFGPFAVYALARSAYFYNEWANAESIRAPAGGAALQAFSTITKRRGLFAAELFAACAGTEIGQYFHVLGGTFDPKDILAFGAGITLALLLEKAVEPKPAKEQ